MKTPIYAAPAVKGLIAKREYNRYKQTGENREEIVKKHPQGKTQEMSYFCEMQDKNKGILSGWGNKNIVVKENVVQVLYSNQRVVQPAT